VRRSGPEYEWTRYLQKRLREGGYWFDHEKEEYFDSELQDELGFGSHDFEFVCCDEASTRKASLLDVPGIAHVTEALLARCGASVLEGTWAPNPRARALLIEKVIGTIVKNEPTRSDQAADIRYQCLVNRILAHAASCKAFHDHSALTITPCCSKHSEAFLGRLLVRWRSCRWLQCVEDRPHE